MKRLLLVVLLLLTSICEKAHSEEAWNRFFVDFPYKAPSSLRMLDFLNLRLTWLEGDISALSRLTDMTFPDSHITDVPCDGGYQRFSLINQESYQEYLLRRLACLEWQLKSVQALLDKPEALQRVPEKYVQRLPYLREQSRAFLPAIQNTRHHLNMVFYSHPSQAIGTFEKGNHLVVMPMIMDASYDFTWVRGRVSQISSEWQRFFVMGEDMTVQFYSPDLVIDQAPEVVWDGAAFEMKIPLSDITPHIFSYAEIDGERVKAYELPEETRLSIAFCRPVIPGLPLRKCIHSNTVPWYFPSLSASMGISVHESSEADSE